MSDVSLQRGDIVLVDFDPTMGSEIRKTRPAVVIQNDVGNRYSPTTIVAPLTGTFKDYPYEVQLRSEHEDVEKDSSVLLNQIRTVSVEHRIQRVVGHVSDEKLAEIDDAIRISLGLE